MNYYKLDNKAMDADFLQGLAVVCKVALHPKEIAGGQVKEGHSIIIMLSNRAKYKGRIVKLRYEIQNGYGIGEMEVVLAVDLR